MSASFKGRLRRWPLDRKRERVLLHCKERILRPNWPALAAWQEGKG